MTGAPFISDHGLARSRGGQGGRPRCLVHDGRTRPNKLVLHPAGGRRVHVHFVTRPGVVITCRAR